MEYRCVVCATSVDVPDMVAEVFPEAEPICPKCNKVIRKENNMTTNVVNTDYTTQNKHPADPRADLKEDTKLWTELLNRLWTSKKEVYYTFHGLRCAGSKLSLKDEKIEFTFSSEFNDEFIDKVRKDYLFPHKDFIQIVMNRLAKDMQSQQTLDDCPF